MEISKVLLYPKIADVLRKSGITEKEVLRAIEANSRMVKPKLKLHVMKEDVGDNEILDCAVAAGADFIASGDKHFLELGKFRKTRISAPKEFFNHII